MWLLWKAVLLLIAGSGTGGGGIEPSLAGMMQRQLVLCIKESGEYPHMFPT